MNGWMNDRCTKAGPFDEEEDDSKYKALAGGLTYQFFFFLLYALYSWCSSLFQQMRFATSSNCISYFGYILLSLGQMS